MTAIDPTESVASTRPMTEQATSLTVTRTWRDTVAAYVALTKPRIIELLLVTTVPAMLLAADGLPNLTIALGTLLGGTLAAAGANTMNSYLDRDIDKVMHRTGSRPLATGVIPERNALVFGWVLSFLAIAVLLLLTNPVAAALGAVAIALYVVGYTLLLKRRTPQNIVWGGAAGCMPVLIGWSAVTGSLAWPPVVLFLIVFFWTPPHYWPLSLRYKADYAAANVPMLPVVADQGAVARRIVRYAWAMVATSLVLIPVAGMGLLYSAAAVVLGALFLWEAHALQRRVGTARLNPMRLFHGSITYLSLLFLTVGIDPFLH
ncbi:MAG: heme o synthase [Candidatus Nanopelagicales bacterium]